MKSILSLIIALSASLIYAQDYTPLKSKGQLPSSFLIPLEKRVEQGLARAYNNRGVLSAAEKQQVVYKEMAYSNFLLSGKVLVNDPLGIYISSIADSLLRMQPEFRSQLEFYVVRSPQVSSSSFDNGMIFITIGMLAQAENEAQLAFLLAHEIGHYKSRHLILEHPDYSSIDKSYVENKNQLGNMTSYSDEDEIKADQVAIALMKQSSYDLGEAMSALDVLEYAYLPFSDKAFDQSFLEMPGYRFPDSLIIKETQAISAHEDEDAESGKKTRFSLVHKRKSEMQTLLRSFAPGSKRVAVSAEEFQKLREIARYELCRLYLIDHDYANAIYASYILHGKDSSNIYLQKITARSLYNISLYSTPGDEHNERNKDGVLSNYEKIEGSSQKLYYLLEKMAPKELAMISLAHCWKAHQLDKSDPIISQMCENLFFMLIDKYSMSRKDLVLQDSDTITTATTTEVANDQESSKYDKIRKKQEASRSKNVSTSFTSKAFYAFYNSDSEFRSKANNYFNENWVAEKTKTLAVEDAKTDSLTVIDPFQATLKLMVKAFGGSTNTPVKLDYKKHGQLHNQNKHMLQTYGSYYGFKVNVLDPTEALDINKYNDLADYSDWLTERSKHNHPLAIVCGTDEAPRLQSKYGRYCMFTAAATLKTRVRAQPLNVVACLIFWPVAIFTVPATLSANKNAHAMGTIIYDMKTGKLLIKDFKRGKGSITSWYPWSYRRIFDELRFAIHPSKKRTIK